MNWKHWLAIIAPYTIVAAAAVANELTHSGNVWATSAGGLILAFIAHRNLLATPPTKAKAKS